MPGYTSQRRGMACSYLFFVLLYVVCFVLFSVLFVCVCVLYDCHRVATQLQLNVSYHIISVLISKAVSVQAIKAYRGSRGITPLILNPVTGRSHFFFAVALRPNAGHGLLILEVSRSHTTTHHSR